MKSTTVDEKRETIEVAEEIECLQNWEQLLALLPADLEASARESKALVRRRGIQSAADLLHICLVYAASDWSLRVLGAWCLLQGICDVSDVALLGRLRQCRAWLGHLVMQMLNEGMRLRPQAGVRLRLIDGTVISRPGSKGSDWRVHVSLDLGQMCLDGIEVTDATGGESLARFETHPDEIVVADRGFAFASSLGPLLEAGTKLVVRLNWQNLPLSDDAGKRFAITPWLQEVVAPAGSPQQIGLWVPTPQGSFRVRLVATALPQEAADRARQRVRRIGSKKGHTPDERTLLAAGFVFVLTTLPPSLWPPPKVLSLYRIRWQVELAFKQLKSILQLDGVRAQDTRLAHSYFLAKLLVALLIDRSTRLVAQQMPHWFLSDHAPASTWRLTVLLWDHFSSLLKGTIDFLLFMRSLPRLHRFLCNRPRQRPQQDVRMRNLLSSFVLG